MQFDTLWPADSVEFCPQPSFQHVFACGTYKLVEADGTSVPTTEDGSALAPIKPLRLGKCLVFEVTDEHTGSL
jgi:diphthamide biosynthesis protein 7